MDIEKQVIAALENISGKKVKKNDLIKNIGIDSLDLVEMVVEFEEKTGISVPDDELRGVKSVAGVISMFKSKVK